MAKAVNAVMMYPTFLLFNVRSREEWFEQPKE
jgi:hypothetical protein